MVIAMTILKIAIILCILTFIFLILMVMGIIPYKRSVEFIKKYKVIEAIFSIMCGIGILSSFIVSI